MQKAMVELPSDGDRRRNAVSRIVVLVLLVALIVFTVWDIATTTNLGTSSNGIDGTSTDFATKVSDSYARLISILGRRSLDYLRTSCIFLALMALVCLAFKLAIDPRRMQLVPQSMEPFLPLKRPWLNYLLTAVILVVAGLLFNAAHHN